MSQIVEKYLSCNVEKSFKKFLDLDLEANYFQNVKSSSLSTDTCGKNFIKVRSVVFSERELMFTFAICRRPSVCRLSSVCNVRAPYSAD